LLRREREKEHLPENGFERGLRVRREREVMRKNKLVVFLDFADKAIEN